MGRYIYIHYSKIYPIKLCTNPFKDYNFSNLNNNQCIIVKIHWFHSPRTSNKFQISAGSKTRMQYVTLHLTLAHDMTFLLFQYATDKNRSDGIMEQHFKRSHDTDAGYKKPKKGQQT